MALETLMRGLQWLKVDLATPTAATWVTAIATVVNVVVLLFVAKYTRRYMEETAKQRDIAERQLAYLTQQTIDRNNQQLSVLRTTVQSAVRNSE